MLEFFRAMRMFHKAPHSVAHNLKSLPANPDIESSSIQVTGQKPYDTTLFEEERFKARLTDTHADLLSTLPFEVISHIFCHACIPIHRNRKWERDCDPLLLGRISRRYRQYAWATSELWTTIIIQVIPSKLAAQTELLEEWIARTMGRPIDIYFEIETRVPMQISALYQSPLAPMTNHLSSQ
jgi:hypothetical protein